MVGQNKAEVIAETLQERFFVYSHINTFATMDDIVAVIQEILDDN